MKTKILSLLVLCAVLNIGTVNAVAIIRYVTVTGAGTKDGSNWENAADGSTTANIQTQIDAVAANAAPLATDVRGEIRFGAGTYSLSATLTLKDGASLIGGYPTTPVTSTNETRDLVNNQTIFDGGNGRKLMNAPDASGIVYTHITLLDGLIIQRGNSSYGSAMAITYGFVLQNCIIRNNSGFSGSGAAVRVIRNSFNTGANPTTTGGAFINCVFANNYTTKGASALALEGSANSSIINCVFANNVTIDAVKTKVRNTNAFGYFGAVHVGTNNSSMRIVNNIFYNNSSVANIDRHLGSSYYLGYIYNNYFDGDAVWLEANTTHYVDLAVTTVPGSSYYRNFTANNNKCNVDYAASTIFASPNTVLGISTNQTELDAINNSDWRLKASSPCINAGISSTTADLTYPYSIMLGANRAYSTVASDLSGNNRVDGTVDMGAYESKVTTSGNTITISNGEFLASSLNLDGTKDVIVGNGGTLTIDGTTNSINSLTINGGGKVTNNAGSTLTTGSFTINSDASNVLGTYLDNGTTSITNAATVNRHLTGTTGSGRANWYISSPVSGATAGLFNVENGSAPINKLAKYNEAGNPPAYVMVTSNAEILNPGVGYVANIAGADAAYSFSTSTGDATAKLNNGLINLVPTRTGTTELKRGFNLVGNPYPSFLDWNAVTKTNVRSTIWYRTFTGASMQFDTFDGTIGTSLGLNGLVSKYIPPMQAFWVKVDVDATPAALAFDNTMRSHQSQALTNRLRVPSVSNPQILRLKVSNGINADEAIVVTNSNATDGFDRFDSPKMPNANAVIPEIFTLSGNEETVINYLNSISVNKQLALGFRTGTANTFSIKATEISNFDADTKIVLKDNELNTEQDLTDGSAYSFSSGVANTATRFSIIFKSASTATGLSNNDAENLKLNIYRNANNQITINRYGAIASEGLVTICNALGQKLLSTPTTGVNTLINKLLGAGVYLVTVSAEGKNITKKVIIN